MPSNEPLDFAKIQRSEVDELFGPKSNSRKAAEVLKYDPDRYHAVKQAGCYVFGAISESMLPVKHRISKEDLEAKLLTK